MQGVIPSAEVPQIKTDQRITRKQKRFVEEYMKDKRPKEAAHRAGYSIRRANQAARNLLKKQEVRDYMALLEEEAQERNHVTQDYFIVKLKEIIEGNSRPNEKTNALALLARITGHVKERPVETKQTVILHQMGIGNGTNPEDILDSQ